MKEIAASILAEFNQNSALELTAVMFAIVYLLLAVRQNIACWYAAAISTSLFLYVFWQVNLYMESLLQVYYLGMAAFGWWQWKQLAKAKVESPISTWAWQYHFAAIAFVLVAAVASGWLLSGTNQRLAYIDAFTTWGAVITTYMVAKKVLENWIYWLVVDGVAIFLYIDRELYFTALLFALYIVIIFFGFAAWLREFRSQPA